MRARNFLVGFGGAHCAGFCIKQRSVTNRDMPGHAGLPRENDAITQDRTPTDPTLGNQQAMLPHRDIVRHLHEVIDFSARPDSGGSKACPIYRTVGSNIHICFSDNVPNLRQTLVLTLHRCVPVTIRTNHTARKETVAFTDDASICYDYLRKQMTFLADLRLATD